MHRPHHQSSRPTPHLRRVGGLLASAAVVLGFTAPAAAADAGSATAVATTTAATTADAVAGETSRGPDPTESFLEQRRGNYSVAERGISRYRADGFGGGTIHYPSGTEETFGVVAISPGYTAGESSIAWLGPRLASFGFVVVTISTESRYDQPRDRAPQLLAAIDHAVDDRVVGPLIDEERQAVMGHSMGGGGALQAAVDRDEIDAVVPMTPWNLRKDWRAVDAATLVIGAERDTVAPVSSHALPFYRTLTGAEQRAYLELARAGHLAPNRSNTTIAEHSIAWLKRHLDDDLRYEQFLDPGPETGYFSDVSDWRLG